jgi:hypothetical protein
MWFNEICKRLLGLSVKRRTVRPVPPRCRGLQLRLEQLEDRTVPSSFTAANVSDLIADINAANLAGGSNTITLVAGTTYTLTAVDNNTDGPTGLPVITANDNLAIIGNGDVIERSTATGTPALRLFDVAAGAVLNLTRLTLQGGTAASFGVEAPQNIARGGAVYNVGTLNLDSVTVQGNTAQGRAAEYVWGSLLPAANAEGGGIYSSGLLTITDCTIQNNAATGGRGADGIFVNGGAPGDSGPTPGTAGGSAFGGGLCVDAGTVTIRDSTFAGNTAQGGDGGRGYKGQPAGKNGQGIGGGLYLDAASVDLDSFTVANVKKNHASTTDNNIHGSYVVIP